MSVELMRSARRAELSAKEVKFLNSIENEETLTERQVTWLQKIAAKAPAKERTKCSKCGVDIGSKGSAFAIGGPNSSDDGEVFEYNTSDPHAGTTPREFVCIKCWDSLNGYGEFGPTYDPQTRKKRQIRPSDRF